MPGVPFPMALKWAISYHKKGGARFLDVVRIYADATWDHHPMASINLDHPFMLLSDSPKDLKVRPSHMAQATDLLPSPELYLFMGEVENYIVANGLFKPPGRGILFVLPFADEKDSSSPRRVIPIDYDDAITSTGLIAFDYSQQGSNTREVIADDFNGRKETTSLHA